MNNIKHLLNQQPLFEDRQIKNNRHLLLEEIWQEIEKEAPKNSRKMFFIKVAKIPDHKLLQIKKKAEEADSFSQCFYGLVKWQNKKLDGII